MWGVVAGRAWQPRAARRAAPPRAALAVRLQEPLVVAKNLGVRECELARLAQLSSGTLVLLLVVARAPRVCIAVPAVLDVHGRHLLAPHIVMRWRAQYHVR